MIFARPSQSRTSCPRCRVLPAGGAANSRHQFVEVQIDAVVGRSASGFVRFLAFFQWAVSMRVQDGVSQLS